MHAALLAVLVLALRGQAAVAAPRDQADERSPIRVEGCDVNDRTLLFDPFNSQRVNQVSGVSVRFVDVRDVAATRVEFTISYGGSTQRITVSGTFPSGRPIDRTAGAFAGTTYTSAAVVCRVTSAAFADGSAWSSAR